MLLDKTIRENLDGKYLIIYGESFREGIEYAAEMDIPQIQLRNNTKCNNIDFKELEKIPALKVISFVGNTTKIINLDSIYLLKDIQKIYFQQKEKFKIDNVKYLVTPLIFEDALVELFKKYEFIEVYHFTSSVSLHLKNMKNVVVKGIAVPYYNDRQNELRRLGCEFVHVTLGW